MSNKADATTMKPATKDELKPKLRFPEFRDAGEWEAKRLGEEGEFLSSLVGKKGKDFGSGSASFITYMNVFSNTFVDAKLLGIVDVKEGEKQNSVVQGDVFFTVSSETPDEAGMSSVLLEELENCYLNSFCALFRFFNNKVPNLVFIGYVLRQPVVRNYFSKIAQGSTRFNLSKEAFKNLPILIPSPDEQQKIADCISSIDELVAAQTKKLATLKTHKKGLMQQLFPAEGETLPKLRFPEFRDAGEWKELALGEVGEIVTGKTPSTADDALWNGEIQFVTPTDIKEDKYQYKTQRTVVLTKRLKILPKHSIMFTCIASVGKMALSIFPCITNQQINTIIPKNIFDNEYVYYALLSITDYIKSTQANSTLPIINKTEFSGFLIPVPLIDEQQKIADCLSSIDEMITAQTQILDTLKTHKKGLMQQLFPALDEVLG